MEEANSFRVYLVPIFLSLQSINTTVDEVGSGQPLQTGLVGPVSDLPGGLRE